jgi:hypothetical protein
MIPKNVMAQKENFSKINLQMNKRMIILSPIFFEDN